MPDISEYEINSLKRRAQRATEILSRTSGELKKAQSQIDTSEKARLKAEAELQRSLEDNPLRAENERLKAEIREGKHRAEFARVAASKGASPIVVDSLWKLSGYEAKGDVPDPEAIGVALDVARGNPAIAPLFGAAPPAGPPPPPPPRPGIGSGQGARDGSTNTYQVGDYDDPRAHDAAWQYQNFAKIAAAAKDRINRGEI